MQLAFYRGPASDKWHQLSHKLICWFTGSDYSHVELVIDGTSYSASSRDGGVRGKVIDFTSGKWDVVNLPADAMAEVDALEWFSEHMGQAYDYAGVARFILPFLPQRSKQWFCSESVAAALGLAEPADWTPGMLSVKYGIAK